jgi:RHS repeat-associated protein
LSHAPDLLLRGDTAYRVVTDQLGSVRAVVRTTDGAMVQRTDYDAWGATTADTGGAFQSLGYAGGLTDRTTGLVRFGARDYDASVGRWTGKDALTYLRSYTNRYVYVENGPLDDIDDSGLALDSYSAAIEECLRRPTACQREECLRALLETDPSRSQRLLALIREQQRQQQLARDLLAREIRGSAGREFPSQHLDKTLEEIMVLARRTRDVAARKALKLLTDKRFRK